MIVAAEWKQRLQCREGAPSEGLAKALKLGDGGADSGGVELRVACGLLHQGFFGLGDQPGLQLPIAADALGGFFVKSACKSCDLAPGRTLGPAAGAKSLELRAMLRVLGDEPAM